MQVSYILAVKEILSSVQEEGFLADLLKTEGAPKLTSEQVEQLKQFAQLVTPDREINEKGSFDKQVNNSAKHLVNLSDKKVSSELRNSIPHVSSLPMPHMISCLI